MEALPGRLERTHLADAYCRQRRQGFRTQPAASILAAGSIGRSGKHRELAGGLRQVSRSRRHASGKRPGDLGGRRTHIAEAANGVSPSLRRRNGNARDRRGDGHQRKRRESASLSGGAYRPQETEDNCMNNHLTSEQISRWLTGERTFEEETHLRGCARCAAEVEVVRQAF